MADNAKDLQLRELKDTISQLNTTVRLLQQTIESMNQREAELRQERDNLKDQIDFLTKKLFGSSSEKGKGADIPGQLNLFNEAEAEQDPDAAKVEEEAATAPPESKKTRKLKTVQAEKFAGLPVDKVYIDLPEDQKICSTCGTPLEKIGTEYIRRELKYIPARLRVVEYYSINYNCPTCEEDEVRHIFKGRDWYEHRLHGMASPSTIAWVMYQKYCNHIPLYRQEKDWEQYGAYLNRSTLANWIIKNSEECFAPMYAYFKRLLLARGFLMADETPLQVLKEPGRRAQTKSYMWIYRTGEDGDRPIIMYKYSQTRAGDNAKDFLDGFEGYLMCDGYSGYNKVTSAKRCSCWAHVRRYLIDAIPKGKDHDLSLPSVQGLTYVNQLFHIEKEIKAKHKTPDAIKKARLRKEKPILEGFWSWLEKQMPTKGSRMAKAVTYIRNRQPFLATYLEDGRCSFSNNYAEQSVKPFVMGRKNWLFSDTPEGADSSAMVFTIIETAKASGVNIYHYLTYLLEKCPSDQMSDEELDRLAPWNEDVKQEVEQRSKDYPIQ